MTDENPAEVASKVALAELFAALERRQSFVLEAGAGAGKTYSLVEALKYLIAHHAPQLLMRNQRVACITYTNVASNEIKSRTDGHPVILSSTIHSFCWSLISPFQPVLREKLPLVPKWEDRLSVAGGFNGRRIAYDLGYPTVADDAVMLGHSDVIKLTAMLMENSKFRDLFKSRFPILLIDEYQDTNRDFAEAIVMHFIATGSGPLIGFFGDHWQKIYEDGCGAIRSPSLARINKGANFRSASAIVRVLNAMRPELTQAPKDNRQGGVVAVYHTNGWRGSRRTDGRWSGDLPAAEAHAHLARLIDHLKPEGWDFDPSRTKILMLTHNVLANEQGYENIAKVLGPSEQYIKREHCYMGYLVDTVEPVCMAYESKRYGEMFKLLGGGPTIERHQDKLTWARDMDALLGLRSTGTIGAVLDHLKVTGRPPLPEDVLEIEAKLERASQQLDDDERERVEKAGRLRNVPYQEIVTLSKFINEGTPFSTKHGVKGAEFENVVVVVGRGWNMYDFNKMLEWSGAGVPRGKESAFERNRNLFYVTCSRPKQRLAVLFTQKLSSTALATLESWFGAGNIHAAP